MAISHKYLSGHRCQISAPGDSVGPIETSHLRSMIPESLYLVALTHLEDHTYVVGKTPNWLHSPYLVVSDRTSFMALS